MYHCGLSPEEIDRTVAASCVSLAYMPCVTGQFMPRKITDRPKVIPDGCVNLAFIGQFVELPGGMVCTVETSVRTAMMAAWGLTGLDKPMVPLHEPMYDLRVLVANLKAVLGILGIKELNLKSLPSVVSAAPSPKELEHLLKSLPPVEV